MGFFFFYFRFAKFTGHIMENIWVWRNAKIPWRYYEIRFDSVAYCFSFNFSIYQS